MTRGPKPKPTALKKRAGNPGHRPLNEHEPRLPRAIPPMPRTLTMPARKVWKRLAIQLFNAGVLTELEQTVLAALSEEWATWLMAKRLLSKHGLVALTAGGSYKPSPYIAISNAALANILRILAELGMTPSSRTRVSTADMRQMSLAEVLFRDAEAKTR